MYTLQFGKHQGKSAEVLILKHPDYVAWVFRQEHAGPQLAEAQQELRRLITIFNDKPFVCSCQGRSCDRAATRCSVYQGSPWPRWWCGQCNPHQLGATSDKLQILQSYGEVLWYASRCMTRPASYLKILIREMARAKGLPARCGENQAVAFFQ